VTRSRFMGIAEPPKLDTRRKNTAFAIELTEALRILTTIRGNGAARIGSEFRHKFMSVTDSAERRGLQKLVQEHGNPARRSISIEGVEVLKRRLEAISIKGLAGTWSYPVEGKSLFNTDQQNFSYYDSFILWQMPPIREALENLLERL
jgi:hypothetical protein